MAKYPKFLECVNPNSDDPEELYIIHTQYPRFIAEVQITDDQPTIMNFQRRFSIGGKTEYKGLCGLIGIIEFWDDFKSTGDRQKDADQLAALMRRCADWYHETVKEVYKNEE